MDVRKIRLLVAIHHKMTSEAGPTSISIELIKVSLQATCMDHRLLRLGCLQMTTQICVP
jgi:hypothetical protein